MSGANIAMPKKEAEPRIWFASITAVERHSGNLYDGLITSGYAHVTKKAGLNDLQVQIGHFFNSSKYDQVEIVMVSSVKWSQLLSAFADFLDGGSDDDSDDRGGDENPIEPEPSDGVIVPSLFTDFIERL